MSNLKIFPFEQLSTADLIIDAVYEGGSSGNVADDPISKLIPGIGNMGGFRFAGRGKDKKVIVLYTSGEEHEWLDTIDHTTGQFVYYGDNRTPGHEIHDTPRGGNLLLRYLFDSLHDDADPRANVPPILVFLKYPTERSSRSVQFKGMIVPGFQGVPPTNDLVAVWKTSNGQRFQNYRALFTILDVEMVSRKWLDTLNSEQNTDLQPEAFYNWKRTGIYTPLIAPVTTDTRTKEEQLPRNKSEQSILNTIYNYFKDEPTSFEVCAAHLFQLHDDKAIIDEITRKAVDGGRDAVGRYTLGVKDDPIYVEFSLEAKCYQPGYNGQKTTAVGVKEVSRLISRIRNRQFGVLVTTSYISDQAYKEVRNDGHPIIFITGVDIVNILINNDIKSVQEVKQWLNSKFPVKGEASND